MKKSLLISLAFLLLLGIATIILNYDLTAAYGCETKVTEVGNSCVIYYYDKDTGYQISAETAVKYYDGISPYARQICNNRIAYFYYGKEITETEYKTGLAAQIADEEASKYGKNAYRVHTTSEVKAAFDDIYGNLRIGTFRIVFSYIEYSNIDWTAVKSYYNSKYALEKNNLNYYPYSKYGEYLANRWGWSWSDDQLENGNYLDVTTTEQIRITGDQREVVEAFGNKLVAAIEDGITTTNKEESDYLKIMRAYNYLKNNAGTYDTAEYENSFTDSSTNAYAVLINKKHVCIGNAVTFSYLMEKLGIESRIVDNITYIDASTQAYESTHTYNIVKLGGKWYRIDIGSAFLTTIGSSTLKGVTLSNLATSNYNTSGKATSWSLSSSTIDSYRNSAKALKTTTTTQAKLTTTKTTSKPTTIVKKDEVTQATTKKTTTTTKSTTKATTNSTTKQVVTETTSKPTTTQTTNATTKEKTTEKETIKNTSQIPSSNTTSNSNNSSNITNTTSNETKKTVKFTQTTTTVNTNTKTKKVTTTVKEKEYSINDDDVTLSSDKEINQDKYHLSIKKQEIDETISLENYQILKSYDISILDNENNIISITDESFTIKIKLEDDIKDKKDLKVAYLDMEKHEFELYDVTYDGDSILFETTHLSNYVIVEEKQEIEEKQEKSKLPYIILLVIGIVLFIVVILALITSKKIHK